MCARATLYEAADGRGEGFLLPCRAELETRLESLHLEGLHLRYHRIIE